MNEEVLNDQKGKNYTVHRIAADYIGSAGAVDF